MTKPAPPTSLSLGFGLAKRNLRGLSGRIVALLFLVFTTQSAFAQKQETPESNEKISVGSKVFTESVILGEMLRVQADNAGANCEHQKELNGTQVLWNALVKGDIDAYVEYSGTIQEEILADEDVASFEDMRTRVAEDGIVMCDPLGFNNTYAMGMTNQRAADLEIQTIADLSRHQDLKFGFSDEFVERNDGWKGLKTRYQLPHNSVQTLDHSLSYRGVKEGAIDVIDLYSTDAEIAAYDLRVLEDNLNYFPRYEAVILYRADLQKTHPKVVAAFEELSGKISAEAMTNMNKAVRIDKQPEGVVATEFLQANVDQGIVDSQKTESDFGRFLRNTWEHLLLVLISLSLAIGFAVPLGIIAYKLPRFGELILSVVGVIQTIPSLALMVFLITLAGMDIGPEPAIVALFLYSLLHIVRGTHTGLSGIAPSVHESALALGLGGSARLRLIELPLASQSILSGIKTAAVINVGTATIGALIGAGGYGQPIRTGIRLDDMGLILQGAIPAAVLALIVQWGFGWAERYLVPAGLTISPGNE